MATETRVESDVAPGENDIHNEFFRDLGNGQWAWFEYLGANRDELHRVKNFTRATFIEEVLEPCVDHAGGCGCICVFQAVDDGKELPDWLENPEDIPYKPYDDGAPRSNACYSCSTDDCYRYRTASRKRKAELVATDFGRQKAPAE